MKTLKLDKIDTRIRIRFQVLDFKNRSSYVLKSVNMFLIINLEHLYKMLLKMSKTNSKFTIYFKYFQCLAFMSVAQTSKDDEF